MSYATNLLRRADRLLQTRHVYLYDRATATTTLVSRAARLARHAGQRRSPAAWISADGRYVALSSSGPPTSSRARPPAAGTSTSSTP